MNGKFLMYGLLVTALSTGISWTKFISAAAGNWQNTGRSSGSSWSSTTGSGYGGGSGGHK